MEKIMIRKMDNNDIKILKEFEMRTSEPVCGEIDEYKCILGLFTGDVLIGTCMLLDSNEDKNDCKVYIFFDKTHTKRKADNLLGYEYIRDEAKVAKEEIYAMALLRESIVMAKKLYPTRNSKIIITDLDSLYNDLKYKLVEELGYSDYEICYGEVCSMVRFIHMEAMSDTEFAANVLEQRIAISDTKWVQEKINNAIAALRKL